MALVEHVHSDKGSPGAWKDRVAELIEEHGEPDVLRYDSTDTYWDGHYVKFSVLLIWYSRSNGQEELET